MPRYYIHTNNGDTADTDAEGHLLPDAKSARDAAMKAFPDMARDVLPDRDHRTFLVAVENELGEVIYEAKMELTGAWCVLSPV